jgi:hypothetical protein
MVATGRANNREAGGAGVGIGRRSREAHDVHPARKCDVLSNRHWSALRSPQVDMFQPSDAKQSYGYGVVVEEGAAFPDSTGTLRLYPVTSVWHDGGIPGYRSLSFTLPQQQFGFAALVNGDVEKRDATDPVPCMRIAARETIGSRLPAPIPFPTPQIERDRFVDYVGTYQDRYVAGRAILFLAPAVACAFSCPISMRRVFSTIRFCILRTATTSS